MVLIKEYRISMPLTVEEVSCDCFNYPVCLILYVYVMTFFFFVDSIALASFI